ncbi:hypothetical protein T484DRAFT_1562877, partial [Baffinella frigidus]
HWPPPLAVPPGLDEEDAPDAFLCPITQTLMRTPALVTSTGRTFERSAFEQWIRERGTDPLDTSTRLTITQLAPNLALRQLVESWVSERAPEGWTPPPPPPREPPNAGGSRGAAPPAPPPRAAPPPPPPVHRAEPFMPAVEEEGREAAVEGGTLRVVGVEHDGAVFRFGMARLGALLGSEGWTSGDEAADGVVKGGQGASLRARNIRTGKEGAVVLWGGAPYGQGCWNPRGYATAGDWAAGDEAELLDYMQPAPAPLPVASYTRNSGAGWNLDASHIRFGRCGLVGDFWKELEVEFVLEGGAHAVGGVRTDSPADLPFSVACRDASSGAWATVALGLSGTASLPAPVQADAVRVRWESTDLHMSRGLSTARSGGGFHAAPLGP